MVAPAESTSIGATTRGTHYTAVRGDRERHLSDEDQARPTTFLARVPWATIGLGAVAEINGGIIVRPTYTLGINAVVGTAAGTAIMGLSWYEVQLPLST